MRKLRVKKLGLISTVLILIPAVLIAARCGYVAHWVDTCSAGIDNMPDTDAFVHVTFVAGPYSGQTFRAQLEGPTQASTTDPMDDSINYPGLRPIDGHMDVMDTEILHMLLEGDGLILEAGVTGGLYPSYGAIAELPADPTQADSFFDVYFKVEAGGMVLYNHAPPDPAPEPLRLATIIDRVPPADKYLHDIVGPPVSLYDSPVGGTKYAELSFASHWTNIFMPVTSHIGLIVVSVLLLSVGAAFILRRRRAAVA